MEEEGRDLPISIREMPNLVVLAKKRGKDLKSTARIARQVITMVEAREAKKNVSYKKWE